MAEAFFVDQTIFAEKRLLRENTMWGGNANPYQTNRFFFGAAGWSGNAGGGDPRSCFDLFLRLMDDPNYLGLAFGEISAMLQFNRMPVPFSTLLERQDLHPRLVNGSDYPLPAINALIHTRSLASNGFITSEERTALNEIYDYNPLLFDFVLKRTVRHPKTKQKLAPSVFMENPGLK